MADIAPVAASVARTSSTVIGEADSGAAIAQGDAVYLDANGRLQLADANVSDAAAASVGVALAAAAGAGVPIPYAKGGDVVLGAGTRGVIYVLSANPGKIAPSADLASGHRVTILGVGKDGGILNLGVRATGITV
jgi:hypothetical protein